MVVKNLGHIPANNCFTFRFKLSSFIVEVTLVQVPAYANEWRAICKSISGH
jgi:hypothetical protein